MRERGGGMDFRQARYYYEHRMLPKWFFSDRAAFLGALVREDMNVPYQVMSRLCQDNGLELPYGEEEYKLDVYGIAEDIRAVRLTMPEPAQEPECYEVYFLFNKEFDKTAYFTVEKGQGEQRFLCSWNERGEHCNYGTFGADVQEEQLIRRIQDIFVS